MKKMIIPLVLVFGTIATKMKAQTVVVRRTVHRVTVAPPPAVRVTVLRPLPRVVIAPRPVLIAPRPVVVTRIPPPPSITIVRKKTIINNR